ncbi:glutamate receptor 2.2 [Rhynchospora pubera]|uniref:Glutamate receptor n=1 Tax=Rhynchospora pubera TaxID=906938 RepID=A0AAV8HD54_9POAL|nr:glutamate receptor 2.2 [Rhynchospora pubera]
MRLPKGPNSLPHHTIFHHLLIVSLLLIKLSNPTSSQPMTVKVGFIFDPASPPGMIANTTIPMALDDFYTANPNSANRMSLLTRTSPGSDIVTSASAALELISQEKVHAILGPGTSPESAFVADMGTKAKVPIISISSTSPSVSHSHSPFFIRAAANDTTQASAIAALVKAFGWRRVVPIYQDDDYGSSLIPYLVDALDNVDSQMPYRQSIPLLANEDEIDTILATLQNEQTRVFIVHMRVALATKVLALARNMGMMSNGYVWILTDGLTSLLSWLPEESVEGVLGLTQYYPMTDRLRKFKTRWTRHFLKDYPKEDPEVAQTLSRYAIWAYDAVWAMANASEHVKQIDNKFANSTNGSTDLSSMGASTTGDDMLQAILNTTFKGLGGEFKFVNGELDVSVFYIVNVNGGKGRTIGYYTPKYGLSKKFPVESNASYSTSRDDLGPVIWPGESTVQPKGWVLPTIGRKLRIAVPGPVQEGFKMFLDMETDNTTNQTTATGFVIDMFEAAVEKLPYALPFEYIQVLHIKYDDLVKMIGNGTYDAAVSDMTITYNRSKDADFTLPYMASSLSMVVPVRNERSKNAWIFLKPLKADLWLGSFAFFVFTGAVIWCLEHRINDEFRGPPSNQLGTTFYFAFSTLVFSHRETIVSNLSRFVIIIWVFVVLILQSSYTASLTSTLTVQRLTPTFADIHELLISGKNIGYLEDSFTKDFLKRTGFVENRLLPFKSPDSYEEALSNHTIAAVVDEAPYLQVFLNKYCDNYTMVNLPNKTGGFGFVFPRGSSLVTDLSRAILNITEGDESTRIMQKWFGESLSCPPQDSPLSSHSLDIVSFWGLFLITGATSLFCCLIQLALFLKENRHHIRNITSINSFRRSLRSVARLYDEKDLSSHTFRKSQPSSPYNFGSSPYNFQPDTPMSISNHSGGGPFSSEQMSPVTDEAEMHGNSINETPNHGSA